MVAVPLRPAAMAKWTQKYTQLQSSYSEARVSQS